MIRLTFHAELYDGFAIDEAVKVFTPFAGFTLSRDPDHFVVVVEGKANGPDESRVAAELLNFALGKTIDRSRSVAGASKEGT